MQKRTLTILLSIAMSAALLPAMACKEHAQKDAAQAPTQTQLAADSSTEATTTAGTIRTVHGIQLEDVTVGDGTEAKKGDKVTVQYTGTLMNGSKFDSSYDHGEPFKFKLGAGQVIEGWDQGIAGMKEGGKRILTVPPSKAYGLDGYPPVIPPNATLKFEVELLKVESKG